MAVLIVTTGLLRPVASVASMLPISSISATFSSNFKQQQKKPAEPLKMGFCGLLEGEPTTRLELVTYRLRIRKWVLIINDLQECCVHVACPPYFGL